MSKYFGTDGIRGKAESFTPKFVGKIAQGLANYAGEGEKRVLLGGDTRESSEWIIRDFERAFETLGLEHGNVGVLPTPGINYAFYEMGFDFAVDVTASHNPYTDNGVKIFERGKTSGQKLAAEGVAKIEAALDSPTVLEFTATEINESLHDDAIDRYVMHLLNYVARFGRPDDSERGITSLAGLKIGLDCANGATGVVAERVFRELGAEVAIINADTTYGQKINQQAGSTHLEQIQQLVTEQGLDFGMAFDGDGDRCLMVDNEGGVVDGDKIIAIVAGYLSLPKIVMTVMANQGLFEWGKNTEVEIITTDVGDQNVSREMLKQGILLGGESSGHVILPGEVMGDGILTGLVMSKIVKETNRSLRELAGVVKSFPQVVENFEATAAMKARLESDGEAQAILDSYKQRLSGQGGRLLVRPSGTEDLIRITIWGNDLAEITELAKALAADLKSTLEE